MQYLGDVLSVALHQVTGHLYLHEQQKVPAHNLGLILVAM